MYHLIAAIIIAFVAIVLGLFFSSDSDFYLQFASYNETMAFDNKVVWIAGASSGIGASLSVDFAKAGANVIISARRESMLELVANNCSAVGRKPDIIPLDILDVTSQVNAYKAIKEKYGHVDILVLNAGRSQRSLAVDTTIETSRELFDLNFFSFLSLTDIVLPDMIARKSGQLVVVSSLSGRIGTPITSSYTATKHALVIQYICNYVIMYYSHNYRKYYHQMSLYILN